MFKRIFRKETISYIVGFLAVVVIVYAIFGNVGWTQNISPCPSSSYNAFANYAVSMVYILERSNEVQDRYEGNANALVQSFNSIKQDYAQLSPPSCAMPLHQAVSSYLDYQSRVYEELTKPGVIAMAEAYYFQGMANDYLDLIDQTFHEVAPVEPTQPSGQSV